jgi:hypothetical protein
MLPIKKALYYKKALSQKFFLGFLKNKHLLKSEKKNILNFFIYLFFIYFLLPSYVTSNIFNR